MNSTCGTNLKVYSFEENTTQPVEIETLFVTGHPLARPFSRCFRTDVETRPALCRIDILYVYSVRTPPCINQHNYCYEGKKQTTLHCAQDTAVQGPGVFVCILIYYCVYIRYTRTYILYYCCTINADIFFSLLFNWILNISSRLRAIVPRAALSTVREHKVLTAAKRLCQTLTSKHPNSCPGRGNNKKNTPLQTLFAGTRDDTNVVQFRYVRAHAHTGHPYVCVCVCPGRLMPLKLL